MSNKKRVSIQLAYYTLAQWNAWNGVLLAGQVSVVSDAVGDAVRTKIGDGVTAWNALPYYNPASSSQTLTQTLGFGNTTSGSNLIVTTNDNIFYGGSTKFSQSYDGSTLILQDVASGDGLYIAEGGGTTLRGVGSAIGVGADIDINSAGEIFFTGSFYNFSGLSGNKVTYINNSNHLITTNVVTDNNNLFFPTGYGIDNPTPGQVLNIGASYAGVINYGNSTTVHNFLGTAIYELQVNSYVTDKLITLNYGGAVASGLGVGFEIQENNVITGYFKTASSRDGFEFLSPAIAYKSTLSLASLTADRIHTLPNVAGTLATVNGGQTFTSAVWNGTSITTTYTDAKIKGAIAATAGLIPYGNATADTVTSVSTFKYLDSGAAIGLAINTATLDTWSFGTAKFLTLQTATGTEPALLNLVGSSTGASAINFGNATIRRAGIQSSNGSTLQFFVNATNSGTSLTEAARFLNTGEFLVGYTTLIGTEVLGVQKNQNAATIQSLTNTTSGTSARAYLAISNSASLATGLFLQATSALFTTSGIRVADAAVVSSNKAGGLNVGTSSATPLALYTNDTLRLTISSAGIWTFADANDIAFNTTTGTKIGTATTQKIGFWNKTPIVQPTTGITGATLTSNLGTPITSTDTFGGYTLQQLAAIIINTGLAA